MSHDRRSHLTVRWLVSEGAGSKALCIQATVGNVHEAKAKVTEVGARVTFSGVRVTRMLPVPTVGTDEGDVRG